MDVAPAGMDDPDDGDELGIYKGTRANTVAFGVCNLLFVNTMGGCSSATKSGDRFRGISGVSRFLSRLYRRSGNVFHCCLSR